jgi:hypothetical protein
MDHALLTGRILLGTELSKRWSGFLSKLIPYLHIEFHQSAMHAHAYVGYISRIRTAIANGNVETDKRRLGRW